MKIRTFTTLFAVLLFVSGGVAVFGQDGKIANMTFGGGTVRWDAVVSQSGGTLTITAPDGRIFRKEFRAGGAIEINVSDKQFDNLLDGVYLYELQFTPLLTAAQREELKKARGKDDDPESDRAARRRPVFPLQVQSGSFAIVNGLVIGPGAVEGQRTNKVSRQTAQPDVGPSRVSENTINRLRNHRFSLLRAPDVVTADDEIIQGSLCVGLDCVNNESFGFDTIRLKENNTRLKFDDTSTSAGFPNNDWQLTANDSNSGGTNKFSIDDITGAKTPFTIIAGAPTNSLFVAGTDRNGLGNPSPGLNVHVTATDTPAFRMEQTSGGGFTAQTWDIGANEANWFVRDLTGGSRLPLRIRPGAPTSSIDISASGNVGVGTASPTAPLHVKSNTYPEFVIEDGGQGYASFDMNTTHANGGNSWRFIANSNATLSIYDKTNSAYRVTINNNGMMGIGTLTPDQMLSVNGDASKTGGGSWQVFSDERLKNIKGGFTTGLSALMKLQPVRYEYREQNPVGLRSSGEHIGFGAQTLQKVIPEAVTRNSDGYLMVNNDPIIWTMLNAIKEQQKEIADLKSQIRKLRTGSRRRHR